MQLKYGRTGAGNPRDFLPEFIVGAAPPFVNRTLGLVFRELFHGLPSGEPVKRITG